MCSIRSVEGSVKSCYYAKSIVVTRNYLTSVAQDWLNIFI